MATARGNKKSPSTFGSRTDVGCVREQNEDSLLVAPPLYVVCDGMGGHAAGEVASEIAVNVIGQRAPDHADAAALGQAVEEANLAVIKASHDGEGRAGMGTTCTAAILDNERLIIAQVGDSRAYLLHNGQLQQLTRDHSLVADLIEAGEITPEEALVHPQRSMITRALGSDPRMQPDLYEINVEPGDRLLLCSDGLTTMIDDATIADVLRKFPDPQRCAIQLVNEAIGAGGYDNVTVIVTDVTGFAAVRAKRSSRRMKITAGVIVALLIAIVAGAGWLYSSITSNAAYLAESDGNVAIYSGIRGDFLGLSSSKLVRVTDVALADLQPGLANRLRSEGVPADSVEAAEELVKSYEDEIAARERGDTPPSTSTGDATFVDPNATDTAATPADAAAAAQPSSNQIKQTSFLAGPTKDSEGFRSAPDWVDRGNEAYSVREFPGSAQGGALRKAAAAAQPPSVRTAE